jgi:hypothetical protein
MIREPANDLFMKPPLKSKIATPEPILTAECTTTAQVEKPSNGLDTVPLTAKVKWCQEISAAVVLYDHGIGVEFDRLMKRSKRDGKFKVIQGGADQEKT